MMTISFGFTYSCPNSLTMWRAPSWGTITKRGQVNSTTRTTQGLAHRLRSRRPSCKNIYLPSTCCTRIHAPLSLRDTSGLLPRIRWPNRPPSPFSRFRPERRRAPIEALEMYATDWSTRWLTAPTTCQYLIRRWWPAVKVIRQARLLQWSERVVVWTRSYAIQPANMRF